MTLSAYIVLAAIVLACALLVLGTRWLETLYYRQHPPDDWDGMREDRDHEHR